MAAADTGQPLWPAADIPDRTAVPFRGSVHVLTTTGVVMAGGARMNSSPARWTGACDGVACSYA